MKTESLVEAVVLHGVMEEHCRELGKRGFGVYDSHGACIWYSEWPSEDVTPEKIAMLEQYLEGREPLRVLRIV